MNGGIDIENGSYDELENGRKRVLDAKYAKEVQLCLEVIKVDNKDDIVLF